MLLSTIIPKSTTVSSYFFNFVKQLWKTGLVMSTFAFFAHLSLRYRKETCAKHTEQTFILLLIVRAVDPHSLFFGSGFNSFSQEGPDPVSAVFLKRVRIQLKQICKK